MRIVNIHEAKTHLSRLVEAAAGGESFVIAKAGKPMVKVTALDVPAPGQTRRLGFLIGQIQVPEDFDQMGRETIENLFSTAYNTAATASAAALARNSRGDTPTTRLKAFENTKGSV